MLYRRDPLMFDRFMRRGGRPSGRDLQLLFALTIVLPGLLLGVVGVRAWLQDRRLADQQLRERVDRAADLALRAFEQDLREWQVLLETTERRGVAMEGAGGRLRTAFTEPGAGALVLRGPDGPALWPATQAPYLLPSTAVAVAPAPSTPLMQAAEEAETRARDHARALTLYERALRALPSGQRAATLHRLARTQRKAGRPEAAIAIYRELSSSTERIGPLPADLVARHELCVLLTGPTSSGADKRLALDLYRDLVSGRWRLEQTRYLFYSASVQRMLGDATVQAEARKWSDIERRKLALAEAASNGGEATSPSRIDASGTVVVFRTAAAPTTTLLLSRAWLASSLWPRTFETARASGFDALVHGTRGPCAGGAAPYVRVAVGSRHVPGRHAHAGLPAARGVAQQHPHRPHGHRVQAAAHVRPAPGRGPEHRPAAHRGMAGRVPATTSVR